MDIKLWQIHTEKYRSRATERNEPQWHTKVLSKLKYYCGTKDALHSHCIHLASYDVKRENGKHFQKVKIRVYRSPLLHKSSGNTGKNSHNQLFCQCGNCLSHRTTKQLNLGESSEVCELLTTLLPQPSPQVPTSQLKYNSSASPQPQQPWKQAAWQNAQNSPELPQKPTHSITTNLRVWQVPGESPFRKPVFL